MRNWVAFFLAKTLLLFIAFGSLAASPHEAATMPLHANWQAKMPAAHPSPQRQFQIIAFQNNESLVAVRLAEYEEDENETEQDDAVAHAEGNTAALVENEGFPVQNRGLCSGRYGATAIGSNLPLYLRLRVIKV